MLNTQTFKRKVDTLLKKRGLTIYEVSRLAGHTDNWLYERFKSKEVSMSTIRQVASVLSVTTDYFF